ncbi:MAG: ABC transporter ATP-binding protein [Acidimicrobiia bacterium]|nr:ABC transporter ATP-binding protein [Acidimicrobiia bacterium]
MANHVLVCDGLRKRFGDRVVVDGVSFHIDEGETYGLLGPNGAGKTTTISMLCGLLAPDEGTTEVGGVTMGPSALEARALIGYVPQDLALYPDLSAKENLAFFGKLQGLRGADLSERLDEVLEVVGLAERADERIDTYSGGMKRRANIAVGLLHRPRLLVLDEPTVGVDPQSRNAILEAIAALGGEGLSVLYTTHYMEEAERLCHRVGILDEGRLVAQGTRAELVAQVGEKARVRVSTGNDATPLAGALETLGTVVEASSSGGALELLVDDTRSVLAPLVETAERVGVDISSIDVHEPDLESVFLHLTGKALRD